MDGGQEHGSAPLWNWAWRGGPSVRQVCYGSTPASWLKVKERGEEDELLSNLPVGDGSFAGDEIAVGDKGPSAQQDEVNQAVSEMEEATMHSSEEKFVREEVGSDAVRKDAGIDGLIAQHGSARQEDRGGGETPEGDEE